ncbi:hypothetical protein E1091_02155 [Micromonospora fluostatini]|uniref:Flavin reductase n=1 Tax=Micromonospora fluostatini TaxID=1629071 RepID=A0ABY2DL56_9ACTN|nr:hypothetical protein E1091_02155 [Micromonospora fluostatini]
MSADEPGSGESGGLVRGEHVPSRPQWHCRACGHAWPCTPARELLLVEYAGNRVALSLYLAACLHEAIDDLRVLDARSTGGCGGVFDRFLGWTHRYPDRQQPTIGPSLLPEEAES